MKNSNIFVFGMSVMLTVLTVSIAAPCLEVEEEVLRKKIANMITTNSHKLHISDAEMSLGYADDSYYDMNWEQLFEVEHEKFTVVEDECVCSEYSEHEKLDDEDDEACVPPDFYEALLYEKGASENYVYTFNDEEQVFTVGHRNNNEGRMEGRRMIPKDIVFKKAKVDVAKLLSGTANNVEITMSETQVTELTPSGVGKKEVVSYTAYVKHFIGGMQVLDHRMVVSYFVDGRFQGILMKWPKIAPNKHENRETMSDAEIIDRIYSTLRVHPLGDSDEALEIESALRIDKDGKLYQILRITGHLKADFGKSFLSAVEVRI